MINFYKDHFKLTTVYTFFAAFPALLQLIVYPVIEGEKKLGAIDFGYLAITEAIISIIFIICTFGMGSGITRFFYDFKDSREKYNRLVSTVISGILGRGMLLMGIVLILAPLLAVSSQIRPFRASVNMVPRS
jgi:O-antigen/teichoic acid export membrane protein